uniref:Uncharacterized protein n=1 Tax=viral metagenome TaxID=1070528 RepID=A0A6C0C032_9ZZZZ
MQSVSTRNAIARAVHRYETQNGYETDREDDANLVFHTFSSVDFTFAKLDANGVRVTLVHEAFTSQVCSR